MGGLSNTISIMNGTGLSDISDLTSFIGNVADIGERTSESKNIEEDNRIKQQRALQEKQRIENEYMKEEEERKLALKKQVAARQAAIGSMGISGDGSNDAFIKNLINESDKKKDDLLQETKNKLSKIDQSLGDIQRKNLIDVEENERKNAIDILTGY